MTRITQATDSRTTVRRESPAPLVLRAGFWFSLFVAVAVVIRRVIALANPAQSSTGRTAGLDLAFAQHTVLTLGHIIPALFFVLLAPIVILWRRAWPAWADLLFYPLGAVVGLTAYAMSA